MTHFKKPAKQEIHTLHAIQYTDGQIVYGFCLLKSENQKSILKILSEDMTTERMRAFQACDAETTYDIVQILLAEKGQYTNNKI